MDHVTKILMASHGPCFSRLAQGYWRLGDWGMTPQQRLTFLEQHLALGISTVDNAAIYGDSERLFGEALALQPSIREQLQIISKFGISPGSKLSHYDSSRQAIITSVERSLRRLGVEQLDTLLVHRPDMLMDVDSMAETFTQLTESGKVLHFGVSNFTPSQFELLQSHLQMPLITNQVEINPLNFNALEDGTTDQLQRLAVRPMAWSCLAGGRILTCQDEQTRRLRHTLNELKEELNCQCIEQVIFAWLLKHPASAVLLLGTGKIERIKMAVDALQLKLSHEQWYRVWVAAKGHGLA